MGGVYLRRRRWLRAVAAGLCLILTPSSAAAHDMWLAPERFALGPRARLRASLEVGEALVSEQSKPHVADRTTELAAHHGGEAVDLRPMVREGADPALDGLRLRGRGEHLIAIGRAWAFLSLPADRFAEYLTHEGIDGVLDRGAPLTGEQRERYRRSIKTLVRVGRGRGGREHARVLGHPLEVVLLDAPARLRGGDRLRARLLRSGRPLADHVLTAHVRDASDRVTTIVGKTDAEGVAEFPVTGASIWLLRAVHMQRCDADCGEVAWQSDWTAFTFAVGTSGLRARRGTPRATNTKTPIPTPRGGVASH